MAPVHLIILIIAMFFGTGCAVPAAADDYRNQVQKLERDVTTNPLTQDGYWLEMKNVMGEWEKMLLVFGYAGDGDLAACKQITAYASSESPQRIFRCNPVK